MPYTDGRERPSQERIVITSPHDTVQLKQLVLADAPLYFALIEADRAHLSQQYGKHTHGTARKYQTLADVEESILHPENPSRLRFGIWDGDTMVGSNNLVPDGEGRAELGSWVGKEYLGHRYAARGRQLLTGFAFGQLGLEEVHCDVAVGNEASRASVESSGFAYSGVEDDYCVYTLHRPNDPQQ